MAIYHPFDPANIINIPHFSYEDESKWQGFHFEKELQTTIFDLPDVEDKHLQDLQPGAFVLDIEEVPLPSLEGSSASSYTTAEDGQTRDIEEIDKSGNPESWDDVWTFPEVRDTSKRLPLTSWDHFSNDQHQEPENAYLSEAGAPIFDAILSSLSGPAQPAPLVASDKFLHALYELGLGRSSILFQWSQDEARFGYVVNDFTITGCTPGLVKHVVDSTAAAGAVMRKLSSPDIHYSQNTRHARPGELAFRSVLTTTLMTLEQYMDNRRHDITSILCLQETYSKVTPLLDILHHAATLVNHSDGDHALLRSLLGWSRAVSLQHPHFGPALDHLVSCVAQPVLRELSCDIGLDSHHCTNYDDPHTSDENHWTGILPPDILQLVQQTSQTLKLLKTESENFAPLFSGITDRDFRIGHSWTSILNFQAVADEYEETTKSCLISGKPPRRPPTTTSVPLGQGSEHHRPAQSDPFQLFDFAETLPALQQPDQMSSLVLECFNRTPQDTHLGPSYDEALVQSISPLLFAQHRLASYSIFELLFVHHKIISHLTLQHQIQLLGDGMFATRLSIALFDPEQSSGQDRRRTGATTGLRLQTREAWPPASSELRLVLMGVLSESLNMSSASSSQDTVSFAIRDMLDEDLEKCREVDSIHALDFLKLQFRAPSTALEAVISRESLEKYDRIFQHLLRVLRMKSVAQNLLRGVTRRGASTRHAVSHKFHIEIQQFITAIADYCQNVAVSRPWTTFLTTMVAIENKLAAKDYDGVLSLGQSLDSLKERHEQTLDSVLRALLLKRKQKQALEVLEKIFGVVLQYAAALRSAISDEMTMRQYHEGFRTLIKRFVVLLREVVGDEGKERNVDGGGMFEELLLRVDFIGYWSR